MKNTLFILFSLFSCICHGQVPDNVKKTDTLYFYFDYGKFQKKTINGFFDKQKTDTTFVYTYKISTYQYIYFLATKYKYISEEVLYNEKTLKKSFLRKNKDIVITIDDLIEYGMKEFVEQTANKVVYVIDTKKTNNGKIIAREATYYYSFTGE